MDMGYEGEYIVVDLPGTRKVAEANFADMPSYLRPKTTDTVPEAARSTCLVSTWALSETPVETREEVMSRLKPDGYLFTYQRNIFDVDNEQWFSNLAQQQGGSFEEIDFLGWDGGSAYLCK